MTDSAIFRFRASDAPGRASLRVRARKRSACRITPLLTGKFCEHLGSNISNGMWAQVLRNPTFADWPFGSRGRRPCGGAVMTQDEDAIAEIIRLRQVRFGWPEEVIVEQIEARRAGLAHFWIREGGAEAVIPSPDTDPHGGRAQRLAVLRAEGGIAQWTYLPLHRVRTFRWRVVARSDQPVALRLKLTPGGADAPAATAEVGRLADEWQVFAGEIEVAPDAAADAIHRLSLTATTPGQFVVARVLLEPVDAVDGADPDVIRMLAESRLPILRWPGGNFASGYHWEDGVGPPDERPTRPNPAWGGAEPNLFGTDEFVAFCRAVGCEPLICVNAGNGTPEEAAAWVEYCNGSADTPQGARRAANGHPEPYGLRYWEIGNELYGRHQVNWSTAAGYADRYRHFVEVMRTTDPDILFIANGAACLATWQREDWNGRLLEQDAPLVRSISDHVLLGGVVPASTDPLDLYFDSMAMVAAHEPVYAGLRERMRAAGIAEPRLAITEMQLFTRPGPPEEGETACLTAENMVNPATMAEAIYNTLFGHLAVRMTPFIEMITHSATVNHGGGLRKERERVYANPCHHAHTMFSAFNGATPVAVELQAPEAPVRGAHPGLERAHFAGAKVRLLDAAAALAADGALLVSLVHRGTEGPIDVEIALEEFAPDEVAELTRLAADVPWAKNTPAAPETVSPVREETTVNDGRLRVRVAPFSIVHIRIAGR